LVPEFDEFWSLVSGFILPQKRVSKNQAQVMNPPETGKTIVAQKSTNKYTCARLTIV
jgi:hypothetical protein